MELKTVLTCPLGAKCTEIKNDTIHRCVWLTKLMGTNPNTGEKMDEEGCAMSFLPILLVENSMQQRSTSAAVESFRNEMTSANQTSQQILLAQVQQSLLNEN
jgi:hypothetical protein